MGIRRVVNRFDDVWPDALGAFERTPLATIRSRGQLRGKRRIAAGIGHVRCKMGKHFHANIEFKRFGYQREEESIRPGSSARRIRAHDAVVCEEQRHLIQEGRRAVANVDLPFDSVTFDVPLVRSQTSASPSSSGRFGHYSTVCHR